MMSIYKSQVVTFLEGTQAPQEAIDAASESIIAALYLAGDNEYLRNMAQDAFMSGFSKSLFIVAGVAFIGFIGIIIALPHEMPEDYQTEPEELMIEPELGLPKLVVNED